MRAAFVRKTARLEKRRCEEVGDEGQRDGEREVQDAGGEPVNEIRHGSKRGSDEDVGGDRQRGGETEGQAIEGVGQVGEHWKSPWFDLPGRHFVAR